ncbi:MAG: L-aspartate oxidase, partial [Deltaproteobacteria bacterium]|nr:L-aspartate oxidase [Deltaproteobacteria bacterium]
MSGIPWSEALDAWRAGRPAPPAASPLPRDELLRRFHPDHREGAMTPLRVGVSAGSACASELAGLLQADSPVRDVDIAGAPQQDTDVLVIGGGGAGCVAALCAARAGAR